MNRCRRYIFFFFVGERVHDSLKMINKKKRRKEHKMQTQTDTFLIYLKGTDREIEKKIPKMVFV